MTDTVENGFKNNTVGDSFINNTVGNEFKYKDLKYSPNSIEDNIELNILKENIKEFMRVNTIPLGKLKEYIQYGLPQTEEVKEIVNRINQLEIK
jgi:hypothetical protein